jgi:hypothetical protein
MNLESLINKYKIKKYKDPRSVVKIKDLDPEVFDNFKSSILNTYNLTDLKYSTNEWVFYNTRRIVANSKYNPLSNQLFTDLDFDNSLSVICDPIVEQIYQILPNHVPVITQLATIIPQQKLQWHIDVFLYQQFTNKLHIPIITNPGSFFDVFLDEQIIRTHMPAGSVWNINNLALHRSINTGEHYRTHLIIDFMEKNIIDELLELNINFFHTKIPSMSSIEKSSLEILVKKYS